MTRSKRPGRVKALSRAAGRLVAAMTTTPVLSSKPSISVSSWLMVCTESAQQGLPRQLVKFLDLVFTVLRVRLVANT